MAKATLEQARAAKARLRDMLGDAPEFAGVGVTRVGDSYGVKINFSQMPLKDVPDELDGVPIRIDVVGSITKRGDS